MSDYLLEVFGKDGLFAARFPGYEMRPGQVALARVVDQAMRQGRHALGEGPCGTGKSIAYAVPAAWHAHHDHKRVVIATANIALQEQLIGKDLPTLASVLPWSFSFALLKGRSNYLCLHRLAETTGRGELRGLDDRHEAQLDAAVAWAAHTKTGDLSELSFVPSPAVWSRIAVSADECKGDACPVQGDCFSERARAKAASANLIVTNYHLLFAHLALRRETGQDLLLPELDRVVLDEAHEAADIAREFFGFAVSETSLVRLGRSAEGIGQASVGERLRREAGKFFAALAEHSRIVSGQRRLRSAGVVPVGRLLDALRELGRAAATIADDEARSRESRMGARNTRRQAETTAARLREGLSLADSNKVYWLELDAKGRARLRAKPIDVSTLLAEELFAVTPSVSLISATLTTSGGFDFVRRELGVPAAALEVIADTPFDFRSQALLVVPAQMPDPRAPGFIDAAATAFQRVIELCDGRTLGLFTSYRNLNAVYERVRGGPYRILRQGELARVELTRLFAQDISSVLLGTDSFWTGVDVPGQALTALVIDKLPFPPPDDPLIEAICERDRRAFDNFLVPRAILMLRQGVGRLIRSQRDVGVVVILDPRIAEKPYGRRFLKSLPPMLSTRNLDNIAHFLAEVADARTC